MSLYPNSVRIPDISHLQRLNLPFIDHQGHFAVRLIFNNNVIQDHLADISIFLNIEGGHRHDAFLTMQFGDPQITDLHAPINMEK